MDWKWKKKCKELDLVCKVLEFLFRNVCFVDTSILTLHFRPTITISNHHDHFCFITKYRLHIPQSKINSDCLWKEDNLSKIERLNENSISQVSNKVGKYDLHAIPPADDWTLMFLPKIPPLCVLPKNLLATLIHSRLAHHVTIMISVFTLPSDKPVASSLMS